MKNNKWEEEFEDKIKLFCGMDGIEFMNRSICEVLQHIGINLPTIEGSNEVEVKIKVREGVILIERI